MVVLDADGVSQAAVQAPRVQAWLERARQLNADVVISAATLAEVVRGTPRDAGVNRVAKAAEIWPADETVARRAGRLLGRAGSDSTVDALVVATALAAMERQGAARCIVLTSDPDEFGALLAEVPGVLVVPV